MDKEAVSPAPPESVGSASLPEADVTAGGTDGSPESLASVAEHKRKREELEAEEQPHEAADVESVAVDTTPAELEAAEGENGAATEEPEEKEVTEDGQVTEEEEDGTTTGDVKRQRVDEENHVSGADHTETEIEAQVGNGHIPPPEDENLAETATQETTQETALEVSQQGTVLSDEQQPALDGEPTSRKIEVPNNKVGVLIGKAGETIKFLQFNTGAKIQIMRDAEADANAPTRPVQLIGTIESINKAEKLIKDVIAEADAGGSPALVARGFGASQPGAEQLQIQIPNEKVGLIIGKGGETIKNLQTRSRARIQLIPQHLPEGDISKERTVRITGNKEQIEAAIEMIKQVMNQVPLRSSAPGAYPQQMMHRHRAPPPAQWGPPATPPAQHVRGFEYPPRGPYPSQTSPYAGYPRPPPSRGGAYGPAWDQRSSVPPVHSSQKLSYDYYRQGPPPPVDLGPAPAVASGGGYYGQPPAFPQSAPGYDESRYDGQAPLSHQVYGQPPLTSQSSVYPLGGAAPPSGYSHYQQPYTKPYYGGAPPVYGPPRAAATAQPGDPMYQGSSAPPYGSAAPAQQQQQQQPYPYGPATAYQQAAAYGQPQYGAPPAAAADGYAQYPQQAGQAAALPAYGTSGGTYTQGAPSSGYGQYPATTAGYGEQAIADTSGGYGYPAGGAAPAATAAPAAEASYGNHLAAGAQAAYAAPGPNPTGYEQNSAAPQQSGTAPAGYGKSLSPQTGGYGQQYAHAQP